MSAVMISWYFLWFTSIYTSFGFARTFWKMFLSKSETEALASTVVVLELLLFIPLVVSIVALLVLPWFDVRTTWAVVAIWCTGLLPTGLGFAAACVLNPEKVHHVKFLNWILDVCMHETGIKRPKRKC